MNTCYLYIRRQTLYGDTPYNFPIDTKTTAELMLQERNVIKITWIESKNLGEVFVYSLSTVKLSSRIFLEICLKWNFYGNTD